MFNKVIFSQSVSKFQTLLYVWLIADVNVGALFGTIYQFVEWTHNLYINTRVSFLHKTKLKHCNPCFFLIVIVHCLKCVQYIDDKSVSGVEKQIHRLQCTGFSAGSSKYAGIPKSRSSARKRREKRN